MSCYYIGVYKRNSYSTITSYNLDKTKNTGVVVDQKGDTYYISAKGINDREDKDLVVVSSPYVSIEPYYEKK